MSEQGQLRSARPHAVPHAPHGMVDRPRIDDLLDHVGPHHVVLVNAPAGSGKTVLVSSWARRRGLHPVGWVNCRSISDRPGSIWSVAVSSLAEAAGISAPSSSWTSVADPRRDQLDDLLLWLNHLPVGSALVFDDLHTVASSAFLAEVQRVINQVPSNLTIVLVTRSDPPIALHRLRLEDRLLDLRTRDLAFTREETHDLLVSHGFDLARTELDLLQDRTEGWAAGLRLAIISMTRSENSSDVLRRPGGMTEAVSGYLADEVLSKLDTSDRQLLLDTCVVDQLTAPLAEALTGRPEAFVAVERIADHIGFLSRVGRNRPAYRYQPMFAEVLRTQLTQANPVKSAEQHRRAAHWYQLVHDTAATVRHSQWAGDWDLAARVLAPATVSFAARGQLEELRSLLDAFPHAVMATNPHLLLIRAITLAFENEPERAQVLLERARADLSAISGLEGRRLRGTFSYASALVAQYHGESETVLRVLDRAGPLVPDPVDTGFRRTDLDLRATWWSTRSAALLWAGQMTAAVAEAKLAGQDVRAGGGGWPMVTGLGVQALVFSLDGRLNDAQQAIDELTRFVEHCGWTNEPYALLADFATAWVDMERGDFVHAEKALAHAQRPWLRVRSPPARRAAEILGARLALVAGRGPQAAEAMLDHAFDQTPPFSSRLLDQLAQRIRVEIALARGELTGAAEVGLDDDPLINYVRARTGGDRLAQPPNDLIDDRGLAVRSMLARAVGHDRASETAMADLMLDSALDLASEEGFRLPFIQFGDRARTLLVHRNGSSRHGPLITELLTMMASHSGQGADLTESLSPRELDVLRHLSAGMDPNQIASSLYVSRNTVRTHIKSIYRKLSVSSKRDAILRAVELDVL